MHNVEQNKPFAEAFITAKGKKDNLEENGNSCNCIEVAECIFNLMKMTKATVKR